MFIEASRAEQEISSVPEVSSSVSAPKKNQHQSKRIKKNVKTCLIVDDSKVTRMVAGEIVKNLGFSAKEASDGQEAVVACKSEMPDAVLLDWNMPVKDGLEFLKELRLLPGGDGPVVIFCTTEGSIDHIQQAIKAGANEYIMKPFTKEILREKLAMVLGREVA